MKARTLAIIAALLGAGSFTELMADETPPTILVAPASQNRPAGTNVTFSVTAEGTPPLRYQWFFNSSPIPEATNSSLFLTNVQTVNAGPYYVAITNDFGGTNSPTATLTVGNIAPLFYRQPLGQSTWPGVSAQLDAGLIGTTPMQFQWRLNGTNLPGATNLLLVFDPVDFTNGGTYTLAASNSLGLRVSSPAQFNVARVAVWGAGLTNFNTIPHFGQGIVPNGLSNLLAAAGGGHHNLALKTDGRVSAWGYYLFSLTNNFAAATNVAMVAAGYQHNLILRSNGTVAAWGDPTAGVTTIPSGLTNVGAIAAGYRHNLAVRSNTSVVAWGLNTSGQTNVPAGLNNIIAVAGGFAHSLALKADGTLIAWGSNTNGQTNVPPGLNDVFAIAAGASNSLALKADGTVVAWGLDNFGQSTVPEGLTNVIAIAAGESHSVALREDGSIIAWGRNTYGQTNVPASLTNVIGVACGYQHTLAVMNDGSPAFVRQPLARIAYENFPAVLNGAGGGGQPLGCQWLRSDTNVPGATNFTLSIASAQFADAGSYQLVVTNILGAITSAPVNLTVIPAQPNFIVHPTNVAVAPGSNALFSAQVTSPWPITFQWRFNNADLPGATNTTLIISNAQPAHEGHYTLLASNLNGVTASSNVFLNVLDLAEALDATNLVWTTFDTVPWKPVGSPVYQAPGAAGCGPLTNFNHGTLQTVVTGPGTLSFRWQFVGSGYSSSLYFHLNGAPQAWLSFSSGWQSRTQYLPAGNHVLTWEASVSSSFPSPAVHAYLDAVNYVSGATPATITTQPATQTHPAGTNVTLSVSAIGTPPLNYQWRMNGTNLPGAIGSSLTLNDVQAHQQGVYSVTVSNAFGGEVSSNVTLTISPSAPVILTQPQNREMIIGGSTLFTVDARGTAPLSYQWQRNGIALAGATASSLTLGPLQLSNGGEYRVAVTNSMGGTLSSNATLLVYSIPDLADALGGGITDWTTSTNAPWFPQTNVTYDGVSAAQSGLLTNTSQSSVLTGTVVGPATVSFWWKVSCDSFWSSLAFAINGTSQASITGEVDWQQKTYLLGPGTNTLTWTLTRGTFGDPTDRGWADEVTITPGWTAVSVTNHPANATVSAGNNVAFNADATGTPPLRFQWHLNGNPVSDATNATYTLVNAQTNHAGDYHVVVTNDYSAAASSNALLTVTPAAPVFTLQPVSATMAFNGLVTFRASAKGSAPLSYQWLFNSNVISGATAANLTLTNLQPSNAGFYSVVVSNELGSITSTNAQLQLFPMVVLAYRVEPTRGGTLPTPPDLTNIVALAAGYAHSLALRSDGTVTAWGSNSGGQTNVPASLSNVVEIAAGDGHSVALRADGTVVAWGDNTYGQCLVPAGLSNVTAIACGPAQTLALRSDGTVVGWGNTGQLNIPAGLTNVVSIASGAQNAIAARADGSLVFWGSSNYGQSNVPAWVKGAEYVAAGGLRSWTVMNDGIATGWGSSLPYTWGDVATISAARLSNPLSDYAVVLHHNGTLSHSSVFALGPAYVTAFPTHITAIAAGPQQLLIAANDGSPVLAKRPLNRAVVAGNPAAFVSRVVGASPMFHQWQFNGADIPGATNNLLVISNTPLSAAGNYRCLVTNALGSVTTPAATLIVLRSTPQFDPGASHSASGGFSFGLSGLSGHGEVVVYTSTNLVEWRPMLTNPPVLGDLLLTDPSATNQPMKFYRAEER